MRHMSCVKPTYIVCPSAISDTSAKCFFGGCVSNEEMKYDREGCLCLLYIYTYIYINVIAKGFIHA